MQSSEAAGAKPRRRNGDICGWCVELGPLLGAQLMSCLPMRAHGCGLVLRTAEPQWSLLDCLGKPGWRQEEDEGLGPLQPPQEPASWTRVLPGPKSQGFRLHGPQCQLFLSPSVSACAIGYLPSLSPSCLHFLSSVCIAFSSLCLCVSVRSDFSASSFFLPLPPLIHELSVSSLPCFSLCSTWVSPLMHCSFLSSVPSPPSFMSSLCSPLPDTLPQASKSYMSQKRKKEKKTKTQKSRTKTDLECVAKCCVLLVASVCVPVARSLPACPSAVCPARLPACPSCR